MLAQTGGLLGGEPTVTTLLGIAAWILGVLSVAGLLFVIPDLHRWILTLLAFTTCCIMKPFYQEVFFQTYRGTDRGFGVTIPDLLFFGYFFFLLLGSTKRKLIGWPYNMTPGLSLILISSISLIGSQVLLYGLFTIYKLICGLVLYWVIVNVVKEKADIEAIITGLVTAVIFQGLLVSWQKFVTQSVVYRATGTFPHPNTLAMYVNLIVPIALSLLLSNTLMKRQNKWAVLTILSGILCTVFSKSRAGLVLMLGAIVLTTVISVLIKPSFRNVCIVVSGLVTLSILGVIVTPQIANRFETAPEESAQTRAYFNRAARAMATTHFFGVGINGYSWTVANTSYYWIVYADLLADEPNPQAFRESPLGQDRLGTVHHIYYLFASETGWTGMGIFILCIVRFYGCNLVSVLRSTDNYCRAVLLGTLIGFTTLHLQGFLEWAFRQTSLFYLFLLISGLVTAIHNKGKPFGVKTKILSNTSSTNASSLLAS